MARVSSLDTPVSQRFQATSIGRAPTATAPSDSVGAAGPKSGESSAKACFRTSGSVRTAVADGPVEEDGNGEGLADPPRRLVAYIDGARRLFGVQGDEGHDVDDAKTGMDAFVGAQVEEFEGRADQRAYVGDQRLGIVDQRENGAIVERVGVQVAQ